MHQWGDVDSQGRDICERVAISAEYVGEFISKWGRFSCVQSKEKFGTARVYCYPGWDSLYSLIWPRRMWIYKWWPYGMDLSIFRILSPIITFISWPYRKWIYRLAYKRAVYKDPDLMVEIMFTADFDELLEGIHGYKHSDYWGKA